jgi:branched-chain amino acid transport system ATP-binding protein
VTALFEAKRLAKRFGDAVVLEDINLAFAEGRLSGIMGPNGAGKTTCFHCLTGRYKPDRGEVWFAGENITGLAPRAIARRGIARSFQIMTLFDEFTARDNVMTALPAFRERGFDMRRAVAGDRALADEADAVLAEVGLGHRSAVVAKQLPYGERRALEIAVALAQRPRVLCLDEPTSGLGIDGKQRLLELVRSLRGKLTIVAIEHEMDFLFSLADHISVIHWGQVVARGTPRELQANEWVRRSNLGRFA